MFLFELRICVAGIVWPRRGRAVVVAARIALVRGNIVRAIRIALSRRIFPDWRVWRVGSSLRRAIRIVWRTRPIVLDVLSLTLLVRRTLPVGIDLWRTLPIVSHVPRQILPDWRRDLNIRTRHLLAIGLHLPDLRDSRGPTAIGLNHLPLFDKRDRRRRRSLLCHDRAVRHDCRRPYARFVAGAKNAALLRSNPRCHRGDWSRSDFAFVHTDHVVVDIPCGNERLM